MMFAYSHRFQVGRSGCVANDDSIQISLQVTLLNIFLVNVNNNIFIEILFLRKMCELMANFLIVMTISPLFLVFSSSMLFPSFLTNAGLCVVIYLFLFSLDDVHSFTKCLKMGFHIVC